jgi:hypothetical protein
MKIYGMILNWAGSISLDSTFKHCLWQKVSKVVCGCRGRCENLEEEYEYRFRVLALNRGGRGEPGPSSEPIIAMHKNIPPALKVTGRGYKEMSSIILG